MGGKQNVLIREWPSCSCFAVGYWEEEHSYSRRSWQRYQREVLQELSCRDEEENDDEEGNKYDSD